MHAASSRAKRLLAESRELVADFVRGQINSDGGFRGRAEQSDLYYTVFAVEALAALGEELEDERILRYLQKFGDGESLDLVHLACLIRCRADLSESSAESNLNETIIRNIEKFRSDDGGYGNSPGMKRGTAYGCFLALGAYQDAGVEMAGASDMANCVRSLQKADGSFANEPSGAVGLTPVTAAALMVLHYLDEPVESCSTDWLGRQFCDKGGFVAMPNAPLPDLLSTATALHALSVLGVSIDPISQRCLDFIDSLWSSEGGFRGNWADEVLDCEYTYYGLLALGHLSEQD